MKIKVGIDISLSSTAICYNIDGGQDKYICYHSSKQSKWHKLLTGVVEFHYIQYSKQEDYSISELYKLVEYNKLASDISNRLSEIFSKYNKEDIYISIEGYSYSSAVGNLIDLVTLGNAIRFRLLALSKNITIIPPSTLKLNTAKMVYKPIIKGKSITYRNNQLISGGSFKKPQMLLALFDYENPNTIFNSLKHYKDLLMGMSNIPKPIDDLIDSFWLKETITIF